MHPAQRLLNNLNIINARRVQSPPMSEDRKRIHVGPPLRRAMNRHPNWTDSKLVNASLARYEALLSTIEMQLPELSEDTIILIRKALDIMPEPPTTYEEIMLVPSRVEIMIGPVNAVKCKDLPLLKNAGFNVLVALIEKAEQL